MASPKQKYSIFKPKTPNFGGGTPGSFGNRSESTLKEMFPTSPVTSGQQNQSELYDAAEANFKTAQVNTGDANVWSDLGGKVNLDYSGITGTNQTPPDTSVTQTDDNGKKVGPYIPNIDSKNIKGVVDPTAYANNAGPTVDYNTVNAVDKTKYDSQHGVFSPDKSSAPSKRVTLGDTLKKGESKNRQ